MKNCLHSNLIAAVILASAAGTTMAQSAATSTLQIGTYDSRALAYAWFVSGAEQDKIRDMVRKARGAQATGDTNRFEQLRSSLRAMQDEIHREVFSTAPPVEALAQLKDRLPGIQKEADVSALVSKWDDNTLKQHEGAKQVDLTDRLLQEFKLTEKELKTVSAIERSNPLPLDKCNELIRKGKI